VRWPTPLLQSVQDIVLHVMACVARVSGQAGERKAHRLNICWPGGSKVGLAGASVGRVVGCAGHSARRDHPPYLELSVHELALRQRDRGLSSRVLGSHVRPCWQGLVGFLPEGVAEREAHEGAGGGGVSPGGGRRAIEQRSSVILPRWTCKLTCRTSLSTSRTPPPLFSYLRKVASFAPTRHTPVSVLKQATWWSAWSPLTRS
jgi:hypothetical protein